MPDMAGEITVLRTLVKQSVRNAGDDLQAQTALLMALADLTGAMIHVMAGHDAEKLDAGIDVVAKEIARGAMTRHMRSRITSDGRPVAPGNDNED